MTQQAYAGPIAEVGLEYFGSYRVRLKPPVDFGVGPYGNRMLFEGIDGDFAGEGLRGRFINGGGDWLLVGADGFARLDVRIQLQTEDGANIYITYPGVIELTERFQQAMSGTSGTEYADQYFRTTPRFETGEPRYAHLTRSVFVGVGHLLPGLVVEYEVYRIT